MDDAWEGEAESWVRWVREPDHDAYWYYAPEFFDQIVPAPGRRTLEIGCGEGRVMRDLVARGHQVVGIDSSPTMLRHATASDSRGEYVLADAAALPFPDAAFDLAVAFNSLMDIDDMPGAVNEAARVLEPGGRLCICVTHPINDRGRFASQEADASFVISGSYLGERGRIDEAFERAGLSMTFHGWLYAFEDYARVLEDAGLVVERVREPAAPRRLIERDPAMRRWQRVPMFLWLLTRKPLPPG